MKIRTIGAWVLAAIILVAIILLLWGHGLVLWLERKASLSPERVFYLKEKPPFLTEALALEKARESLALDGLDVSLFEPEKDDRSKAPDGRPDQYLLRNTINDNDGSIMFRSKTDRHLDRTVDIELKENIVTCQVRIWR